MAVATTKKTGPSTKKANGSRAKFGIKEYQRKYQRKYWRNYRKAQTALAETLLKQIRAKAERRMALAKETEAKIKKATEKASRQPNEKNIVEAENALVKEISEVETFKKEVSSIANLFKPLQKKTSLFESAELLERELSHRKGQLELIQGLKGEKTAKRIAG